MEFYNINVKVNLKTEFFMSIEQFPKKQEDKFSLKEKLVEMYEQGEQERLEKIREEFENEFRKKVEEGKLDEEDKKEIEALKEDIRITNPDLTDDELDKEALELWIQVKADQKFNLYVSEEREREERIIR